VDTAEFVRAEIEVDSFDAIRLVETPVRRGLDVRQSGHGIGKRLNFSVSAGGGATRPFASRGKVDSA